MSNITHLLTYSCREKSFRTFYPSLFIYNIYIYIFFYYIFSIKIHAVKIRLRRSISEGNSRIWPLAKPLSSTSSHRLKTPGLNKKIFIYAFKIFFCNKKSAIFLVKFKFKTFFADKKMTIYFFSI